MVVRSLLKMSPLGTPSWCLWQRECPRLAPGAAVDPRHASNTDPCTNFSTFFFFGHEHGQCQMQSSC